MGLTEHPWWSRRWALPLAHGKAESLQESHQEADSLPPALHQSFLNSPCLVLRDLYIEHAWLFIFLTSQFFVPRKVFRIYSCVISGLLLEMNGKWKDVTHRQPLLCKVFLFSGHLWGRCSLGPYALVTEQPNLFLNLGVGE